MVEIERKKSAGFDREMGTSLFHLPKFHPIHQAIAPPFISQWNLYNKVHLYVSYQTWLLKHSASFKMAIWISQHHTFKGNDLLFGFIMENSISLKVHTTILMVMVMVVLVCDMDR